MNKQGTSCTVLMVQTRETHQLRLHAAEPRSHGSFRTQALLKSALALIKNNGCKREEEEGKKNEKNKRKKKKKQIPAGSQTQTYSAPLANCHLTCRELRDSWEPGEQREGQHQPPNSLLSPDPLLPCCTGESSSLFSQKSTRKTQWVSFVQKQRRMQTQLSP